MDMYAAAGVDYDVLDAGKRSAVAAARESSLFSAARGIDVLDKSRGEPAFVFRMGDRYLAQVLECLGTKSTIARTFQDQTGENRFHAIGVDAVAAIVNDIVCVGALPLVVNAYFATGSPEWYSVAGRFDALVQGWLEACRLSGATWGGGESPGLSGIVAATEIDLAGSATGALPVGSQPIFGQSLEAGDEIVFIESNGLHANGASLIRRIADELPDGYAAKLPSGESFGASVLTASAIYVPLVEKLLAAQAPVRYLSHITGHGMRKLMRADRDFTYRITALPDVPEVFQYVCDHLKLDAEASYATFNMGAGFAVYCAAGSAGQVIRLADECGQRAWFGGVVEAGQRQVILEPVDVTYSDSDLKLR